MSFIREDPVYKSAIREDPVYKSAIREDPVYKSAIREDPVYKSAIIRNENQLNCKLIDKYNFEHTWYHKNKLQRISQVPPRVILTTKVRKTFVQLVSVHKCRPIHYEKITFKYRSQFFNLKN